MTQELTVEQSKARGVLIHLLMDITEVSPNQISARFDIPVEQITDYGMGRTTPIDEAQAEKIFLYLNSLLRERVRISPELSTPPLLNELDRLYSLAGFLLTAPPIKVPDSPSISGLIPPETIERLRKAVPALCETRTISRDELALKLGTRNVELYRFYKGIAYAPSFLDKLPAAFGLKSFEDIIHESQKFSYGDIRNAVRILLADRGISLVTLSGETGIKYGSLVKFENGRHKLKPERLRRIVEFFEFKSVGDMVEAAKTIKAEKSEFLAEGGTPGRWATYANGRDYNETAKVRT